MTPVDALVCAAIIISLVIMGALTLATCPYCGAIGVPHDMDEPGLKLRCRVCGARWDIH